MKLTLPKYTAHPLLPLGECAYTLTRGSVFCPLRTWFTLTARFPSCARFIVVREYDRRGFTDCSSDNINFGSQNSRLIAKHSIVSSQVFL